MIGYSDKAGSLMYKLGICLECRKYLDLLGGLKNYEAKVSNLIQRKWVWNAEQMTFQDFSNWDYKKNTRFIIV